MPLTSKQFTVPAGSGQVSRNTWEMHDGPFNIPILFSTTVELETLSFQVVFSRENSGFLPVWNSIFFFFFFFAEVEMVLHDLYMITLLV